MTEPAGVPVVATSTAVEPPKDNNSPPQVTQTSQAVKSGVKTSEAWFTFIVLALAGLISSGVVGEMTPLGKAIVFASGTIKAIFYTWSRTQVKTAVSVFALLIMSNQSACGPDKYEKAVSATLITANVTEQAFLKFDAEVQAKLVASATDYEGGEKALVTWRVKRGPIEDALIALYRGIAITATLKDDASLSGMMSALGILKQQLMAMGVTL